MPSSSSRPKRCAAAARKRPGKRKRRSVPRPPPPARPPAERVPTNRHLSAVIPSEDLPVASPLPPRADDPLVSSAEYPDGPVMIHNRSVEEYQQTYHQEADHLLRDLRGRPVPYNLALGLQIKYRLWKRLNNPQFTESVDEDGRVRVSVVRVAGRCPPKHPQVNMEGEPAPQQLAPPRKRAKKSN